MNNLQEKYNKAQTGVRKSRRQLLERKEAEFVILNRFKLPDSFEEFIHTVQNVDTSNGTTLSKEEFQKEQIKNSDKVFHLLVETNVRKKMETFIYGTGKPILLISGLGINATIWYEQFKAFSSKYTMIGVNYPGHGLSEMVDNVTPQGISDILVDVLHKIDEDEPFNLIGGSFGGLISQYVAYRYPNKVISLSIVGSFYKLPKQDLKYNSIMGYIYKDIDNLTGRSESTISSYKKNVDDCICLGPGNFLYYLEQAFPKMNSYDFLPEIKVPTFIVAGSRETLVEPEESEIMNNRIKNSQLLIMKDSAHFPMLSDFEELNKAWNDFLNKNNSHI